MFVGYYIPTRNRPRAYPMPARTEPGTLVRIKPVSVGYDDTGEHRMAHHGVVVKSLGTWGYEVEVRDGSFPVLGMNDTPVTMDLPASHVFPEFSS